jgi:hypothetical protein
MTYNKNCKICDCAFVGNGPAARYCSSCQDQVKETNKIKARQQTQNYRIKNGLIQKPGVGSGNNQKLGEEHPSYKHGWYVADRLRKEVKSDRRYCERCDTDLLNVDRWQWVVHHKDHDHYNNVVTNLELLCKRCHQIEHECHKAFTKGATTIPKGSTLK